MVKTKLILNGSGRILDVGDKVKNFRDEEVVIEGWTSGEDWSNNGGTGRVHTNHGSFFPSVIDATIVRVDA